MICSMTAFARGEIQAQWGNAVWEMRSVNHRYLETNFRLPEMFYHLEPLLREEIKKHLQRGKLDISLRYQPQASAANQMQINKSLAEQVVQAHTEIAQLIKQPAPIDPNAILRWPGVLQAQELDIDNIRQTLLDLFAQTIKNLLATRQREGAALMVFLENKLTAMEQVIAKVQQILPTIIPNQREKLMAKFNEMQVNIDTNRLEQELIFYAQKIDINEEIDRLATHINETRKTLQQNTAVGRRLDFLMQELHREANTLGSKSVTLETSQTALELKILIEQMREQVQNIE